jgi:hypothetical protein
MMAGVTQLAAMLPPISQITKEVKISVKSEQSLAAKGREGGRPISVYTD